MGETQRRQRVVAEEARRGHEHVARHQPRDQPTDVQRLPIRVHEQRDVSTFGQPIREYFPGPVCGFSTINGWCNFVQERDVH